MEKRLTQLFALTLIFAQNIFAAEPTEEREWLAKAGTTFTAKAMQMTETAVQLKSGEKLITVKLELLVDEDRNFLIKHFGFEDVIAQPGKPIRSKTPLASGEALGHHPMDQHLARDDTHTAYFLCDLLLNDYGIEDHNKTVVEGIAKELSADPLNARYVEGIAALDEFSSAHFSKVGRGSLMLHTTPGITQAADALSAEFAGVPQIKGLAKELGTKTGKLGGKKK